MGKRIGLVSTLCLPQKDRGGVNLSLLVSPLPEGEAPLMRRCISTMPLSSDNFHLYFNKGGPEGVRGRGFEAE